LPISVTHGVFFNFSGDFLSFLDFQVIVITKVSLCGYRGVGWHGSCLKRKGLNSEVNYGGHMQVEEILTANQVADLLQIHPRTVYKLVKQGSLPGRKFGGGWRFSRSEILAMVHPQGAANGPRMHS
jgi:excisionase family DNA binding protein